MVPAKPVKIILSFLLMEKLVSLMVALTMKLRNSTPQMDNAMKHAQKAMKKILILPRNAS